MPAPLKIEDHLGKTYNGMEILEEAPKRKKQRMVRCKCHCGNTTIKNFSHVVQGQAKSCGCLQKKNRERIKKRSHKMATKKDALAALKKEHWAAERDEYYARQRDYVVTPRPDYLLKRKLEKGD